MTGRGSTLMIAPLLGQSSSGEGFFFLTSDWSFYHANHVAPLAKKISPEPGP